MPKRTPAERRKRPGLPEQASDKAREAVAKTRASRRKGRNNPFAGLGRR